MADFKTPRPTPGAPARDAQDTRHSADDTLDAARDKAGELKEQARAEADATGRQIRGAAEDVKREARDAAERAKEQMRSMAARQKQAAAGQVSGFAQALKSASGDLENRGQQFAARWAEQAAQGLERASDALERRDLDDLMGGVEDFARRQPIAFLGGAALAGFGLARLMKSSADRRRAQGRSTTEFQGHAATPAGGAVSGSSPGSAAAGSATSSEFATPSAFGAGRETKGEVK